MDPKLSIFDDERHSLQGNLDESRKRSDALAGELRALDDELVAIDAERTRFGLLGDACAALEALEVAEAGDLFWSGIANPGTGAEHLRSLRRRVDAFGQRVDALEAKRADVLGRMADEDSAADEVRWELDELAQLEEERRNEWIVEREFDGSDRLSVLPWSRVGEEDRRFRRTLVGALLASLFFALILPLIPLPAFDRYEVIEVPERLARLIEERQVQPPPQVVAERLEPEETLPQEEELLAEEGKPQKLETKEEPQPGAGAKGILAFREQFSDLAAAEPLAIGSQARVTSAGELAQGRASRSLVALDGAGSSGGIDISGLSRNVGGGGGDGMAGVQVARATSSIGAVGGGNDRPLSGGLGSSRTDEEIQIVFDRHKASLYRLYNLQLRRNPTLQGQIVLRMTIEPNGSVSLCEVQSNDMKAPELGKQVEERVKTFDFGAKEGIPAITILYPIDFLPAT